jgi:hypothetical protein
MDNIENKSFSFLDMINILSFWVTVMNLEQNIEQSKEQNINKANEKQQKEILDNIHKQFEKQNQLLYSLEKKIDELSKGGQ